MRTFIIVGIFALIAAILSTGITTYAQDQLTKQALQQRVIDRTADWQKLITVYADALELQEQASVGTTFSLEKLKNLISEQEIGQSGYFIARTSDGVYEVSKDRARDGENIWNAQDPDGNYIVREHTETALQNPEGGTLSEYLWQNNDDPRPREKVGSYAYVEDLDWVIAATAYYDDRTAVPSNTVMVFIVSLIGFGILFFGFAFITNRSKRRV